MTAAHINMQFDFSIKNQLPEAGEMVQQTKTVACEPGNLNLSPETPTVEGTDHLPKTVL